MEIENEHSYRSLNNKEIEFEHAKEKTNKWYLLENIFK